MIVVFYMAYQLTFYTSVQIEIYAAYILYILHDNQVLHSATYKCIQKNMQG